MFLARTMEPEDDSFRILVSEPMRLGAAGQDDGFGGDVFAITESKICFGRGDACISLLVKVEVAELCAHHGVYDILEVIVGTTLTFEGRCP